MARSGRIADHWFENGEYVKRHLKRMQEEVNAAGRQLPERRQLSERRKAMDDYVPPEGRARDFRHLSRMRSI